MAEMYLNYPLFSGANTKHQLGLIKIVLSDLPTFYPSNLNTDYSVHTGIARASKWIKVLRIDKNHKRLQYPIDQLNDIKSEADVKSSVFCRVCISDT
eukprot:259345_1